MHFGEYELSPSLISLFTPTLSSLESFSTLTHPVLQLVLPNLQPGQG